MRADFTNNVRMRTKVRKLKRFTDVKIFEIPDFTFISEQKKHDKL